MPSFLPFTNPFDVDYIRNGKYGGCYLITSLSGNVKIVDGSGSVKWETNENGGFAHDSDILPNGNILIADTTNNRVIEVNIENPSEILWSWDATKNSDINWSQFGIKAFGRDLSYLKESQTPFYWTHLNDVDFINGSQFGRDFNSILISLNSFNLVLEINYSNTKEIIWWYGNPDNTNLLRQQHNPDRYSNGNTVICDSGNDRIIEINTTTKEIVWELSLKFPDGKFRMVRDCDDIGNNQRLITDSNNNRIIIYDIMDNKIIKEFKSPFLLSPYEADLLEDGRIIAGNTMGGAMIILDSETGFTLGMIGFPINHIFPISLIFGFILYNSIYLVKEIKSNKKNGIKKIFDYHVYERIIYLGISILFLIFSNYIFLFIYSFQIKG